MRLSEITPHLDASALAARFVPPRRFDEVSFDTYVPSPEYVSQARALCDLKSFADSPLAKRRLFRSAKSPERMGRYLDGGFGTGKTHLLASCFHSSTGPKAYLTFGELTAFIGFVGIDNAIKALGPNRMLCIDEFELDDVANTLMVVTFLRGIMDGTTKLVVTSNTLPDRLGEQRFTASEFRREIAAIASHFDELSIDGNDFRTSHTPTPLAPLGTLKTEDAFDDLIAHLRNLHPIQYGAMVEDAANCTITGIHEIDNQDDALAFVAFVDRLYDSCTRVSLNGCEIDDIFSAKYRKGGYRKKYGRAESRLKAMQSERS